MAMEGMFQTPSNETGAASATPTTEQPVVAPEQDTFVRRPAQFESVMPTLQQTPALRALQQADVIVAVGSIDGVLTAAAALRNNPQPEAAQVVFTQAFLVDKLDPTSWGAGKNVLFLDLAVNNKNPAMTVEFLEKIKEAGHTIVGICDEHDGDAWSNALDSARIDRSALGISPISGKGTQTNSSGALLQSLLGADADAHTIALCEGADAGDRMKFTGLAGLVNEAVKSKIADNTRRDYLARHFAAHEKPDAQINAWISEYEQILANNRSVIAEATVLCDGMVKVTPGDRQIDVTALMMELYTNYSVVVVDGIAFNPATKQKERQIAFGCSPKSGLDLLAALKAADISASGMPQKASVSPQDEESAVAAVRQLLASKE
jgi:hypothetical protein